MFADTHTGYLEEQTAGRTASNAFRIYKDYHVELIKAYLLLVFPFQFLYALSLSEGLLVLFGEPIRNLVLMIGAFGLIAAGVIGAACVIMLAADICRGNQVSARHAYRRFTIRLIAKTLSTSLLFYLLVLFSLWVAIILVVVLATYSLETKSIGSWVFLLISVTILVVGALIMIILSMFTPIAVVLEDRWGFSALARALALCKGCHLGNLAAGIIMYGVIYFLLIVLPAFPAALNQDAQARFFLLLLAYLVGDLIAPAALVYAVLVYYDLRIRKENYDIAALAEDLKH